jgi:hypothetical protein
LGFSDARPPTSVAVRGGGWDFVRVHFKIWPGQGNLIETTFRQQIVSAMSLPPNQYTTRRG